MHIPLHHAHTDDLRNTVDPCDLVIVKAAVEIHHGIGVRAVGLVDHVLHVQAGAAGDLEELVEHRRHVLVQDAHTADTHALECRIREVDGVFDGCRWQGSHTARARP